MKRLVYFTFLFVNVLLLSCTKDHDIEPKPNDTEKSQLQTSIVGKWTVESRSGRTTADNAFLEFLTDGTCIIYNIADTLVTGKFEATSGTEINLAKFGTLTEVKFEQGKVNLKLAYSGKKLTITAGKVAIVDSSDKTKLLSRNWSLTKEENGADFFVSGLGVDKVTVLFSASGTYLVQFSNKGQLVEAGMLNWKWHSAKADRIVYWEDGTAVNEDKNYVIIRELTKDILKTTEYPNGQLSNLVLIPN
jgi:hypothetical protein